MTSISNADFPDAVPANNRLWPVGIVVHMLFWAALVGLGFPATYWDDAVIVAPALGLIHNGFLDNIYASKEFYPARVYLFYPPTYFFVLAGWVVAFGKGLLSLSAFWALCGLISSISLASLIHRLLPSRVIWLVAPILVFGCIAYTGHRYEIFGFATLLAGLAVGVGRRRFAGYFLLFVTPTVAPTMLGPAAVAVIAIFAHYQRGRFWAELALAGAGFVLAMILLVAGVSGDVAGLVDTMYKYRSVRVGAGGRDLIVYKYIGAVSALGFAAAALQRWRTGRPWSSVQLQLPLFLVAALVATVVTHARPSMIVALNIAIVTVFIISLATSLIKPRDLGGRAPSIALGLWAAGLAVLNFGYARSISVPVLPDTLAAQARAVAAAKPAGATLVAESRIIKEALGYPVGARVEDASVRHAWPDYAQDYHRIPDTEYWIMSRAALAVKLGKSAPVDRRGRLDTLFIAPGMGRVADDRICVITGEISRGWNTDAPDDLLNAACLSPVSS